MKIIQGRIVSVELIEPSGKPLELYQYQGRHFVEAKHLMEYQIRVYCKPKLSFDRTEVLTSIDGRNTLLDEAADLVKSSGMVVSGTNVYIVKGWRIDDEHTKPFVFTVFDKDTVAKQATGSADNLGVIAVAAYREYVPPQINLYPKGYLRPMGGLESFSTTRGAGIGTGMGSRVDTDKVGHTTFTRDSKTPFALIQIYAMPGWWLKEKGIKLEGDANFPSGFTGGKTGYEDFKTI